MNKIILVGNVVKDSEMKTVGENGTMQCSFTLAVNERLGKDNVKTNFFRCLIWGKMAESLGDYITKGLKVAICGRVDIDSVPTEYEGEYKTYVNVQVSELDFCSTSKKENTGEQPSKTERKKRK